MLIDWNFKSIKRNLLFTGVDESHYRHLYNFKNFVQVNDGDIIYSYDEDVKHLFLIVWGEVKIKFSKDHSIDYKYLYDFFGEAEILEGSKRFSCAVANKETLLYKICIDDFQLLTIGNKTIINNLVKKGGTLLDEYNEEAEPGSDSYLDPNNYMEENYSSGNLEELDMSDIEHIRDDVSDEVLSDEELDSIVEKLKTKHQIEDEIGQNLTVRHNNDLEDDLLDSKADE
ncbi:MAG: cyclic nucleotide-binding domain-containing protein [Bacteroidetes bacterium]|nr:cyclic nucleotide-binding domain-containing protein [Bacteroidota bacterium]